MARPTRGRSGGTGGRGGTDGTDGDIVEGGSGVLVSVSGTSDDRPTVRAAGAYAAATGGHLVVLGVLSNHAFAERRRARAAVPELRRFALTEAEMERRHVARRAAREALDGVDVPVEFVGAVGREPDHVLATAREYDCGHVFLPNRGRTRGLTRDTLTAVCERFDGPVTVLAGEGRPDRTMPASGDYCRR